MEALIASLFFIIVGLFLAHLTHRARRSELQNMILRKQQEKNLAMIAKLMHKLYPNGKEKDNDQDEKAEGEAE